MPNDKWYLGKNQWLPQVCQIRVMTEFETITLAQDGAVDFKMITVSFSQNSNANLF